MMSFLNLPRIATKCNLPAFVLVHLIYVVRSYYLLETSTSVHDNNPVWMFLYCSLIVTVGMALQLMKTREDSC